MGPISVLEVAVTRPFYVFEWVDKDYKFQVFEAMI